MMPDRLVKNMAQQSAGLAVWLIPAMCLAWGFWSASSGSSPVFLTLQQDSLVHVSPDQISVSDGSLPDPVRFRHPQPGDKPWVVWYWPGTDVDLRKLSRQLGWIKQQGFGGVEVVITGLGIEPDQRRGCFRDPVWMFTLRELSRMAGHLDLGLDWTLGPGIPADYCQGQQILTWGEAHVRGGRLLSADIPEPVPSSGHRFAGTLNREDVQHDRWISFPDSSHRLLGLWAARAQSDNRSIAYWNTTDQIRLNPDSTFSLMPFVAGDSLLNWPAPPGYWKLIALYQSDLGAAPFHEVAAYREVLASPYDGADWVRGMALDPLFQAFPVDSLRGRAVRWRFQAAVADRFLADQHPFLTMATDSSGHPALLMLPQPFADHSTAAALQLQARPEYVLSEVDGLFRNQFEQQLTDSCLNPSLGAARRFLRQSGSLMKLRIDEWHTGWFTMGAIADVPGFSSSVAGGNRIGGRLIASAAEWSGHDRIAGYAGGTAGDAWIGSPARLKQEIDRLILTGANEIIIDGLAFPAKVNGHEWHPGATSRLQGANRGTQLGAHHPLNEWWPDLWAYTARSQYLQRLGQRETDFLILYPFTRFPSVPVDSVWSLLPEPRDPDGQWEQLSAMTRALLNREEDSVSIWLKQLSPMIRELERWGYTWTWIDEMGIQNLRLSEDRLRIGEASARGLILPEGGIMKRKTSANLLMLQQQGANIFYPGQEFPVANELAWPDSLTAVIRQELSAFRLSYPVSGPGELIRWIRAEEIAPSVPFLLPAGAVRASSRRLTDGSQLIWLVNHGGQEEEVQLAAQGRTCFQLDPESGMARPLAADDRGRWTLSFSRLESRILWMGKNLTWPDSLILPETTRPDPDEFRFSGADYRQLSVWEWAVPAEENRRKVSVFHDTLLWDWSGDPQLRDYQGVVGYSCDVMVSAEASTQRYVLELGQVFDACEVMVNTEILPRQSWPPYRYRLDSLLRPGLNTIQIWVTNVRRNDKVGLAANGDPATAYLLGHEDERRPAGLLGPVTLWALPPDESWPGAEPGM